ncbi:WD40-repeat-containing domain protein [Schizophyllum fasciatum]
MALPHLRRGTGRDEPLLRNGFPYHQRLRAHSSCVNALAFSTHNGGRFMASGGDDLKVQIWDFHRQDQREPSCTLSGAMANIFNITFSASNKYVFSGGADDRVLQYDFATATQMLPMSAVTSSMHRYIDHEDSIRDISCHPYNDEIFMSAGEDGRVIVYDARTGNAQGELQLPNEATGARYNPTMEHIFATSHKMRLQLRDARMAFGARAEQGGVVRTYNTRLTRMTFRGRAICSPEVNSFTFDAEGQTIAATILHHYPVIYALSEPAPVAVCNGAEVPPEQGKYSNSCTMKHGSFSGEAFQGKYYAAGSDDFRGYIWRIPDINELLERRVVIPRNEPFPRDTVAYTGLNSDSYVPVSLTKPVCQLTGHDSIVNTTLFHPTLPHIATAGIERDVLIHGPTSGSPCVARLRRSPPSEAVRTVGSSEEEGALSSHQYWCEVLGVEENELQPSDDEISEVRGGERENSAAHARQDAANANERRTIGMFDYILRMEGSVDVWEAMDVRVHGSGEDSSDEEEGRDDKGGGPGDEGGDHGSTSSSDEDMSISS